MIQHLKNILAAYKYFNSAEGGCNLSEEFQIYVAKKFLKDEIKNKNLYRNHIIPQSESYAKYDKQKTINDLQFAPDYERILLYEQKMFNYSKWVMNYLDQQWKFWDSFMQDNIDYEVIDKIGKDLEIMH